MKRKTFKHLQSILLIVLCALSQIPLFGQTDNILDRPVDTKLRIASYNVFFGSVFPEDNGEPPRPGKKNIEDRTANLIRIHKALKPDIWAMQEVLYTSFERETKTLQGYTNYFNKATSQNWHVAADKAGRIVFSRYPIKWEKKIGPRMAATLIDLPDSISKEDLLLINVHYHWNNHTERIKEATQTTLFLKEVMDGKVKGIPSNSMIMICGDFNSRLKELPYRVISSMNLNIGLTEKYNPVFIDKHPYQLQTTNKSTIGSVVFEGDNKTILGETIDFILFKPDAALSITNNFILNTLILDQDILDTYGLKRNDIALRPSQQLEGKVSYDHLPLVVDLSLSTKNKK